MWRISRVCCPALHGNPPIAATRIWLQLESRRRASGLANILPAVRLDVLEHPWPVTGLFDAVLCINMIHISPWETTPALFSGARASDVPPALDW